MSQHGYTRALVGGQWDLDVGAVSKEVELVLPGKVFTGAASGAAVTFDFDAVLTAGEVTTLDGAVAAHQAAFVPASTSLLTIERYVSGGLGDHRVFDYKAGLLESLHKKVEVMFRGEVRQVRYFDVDSVEANPSDENLWTKVLQVDVVYVRDASDLATSRTTTRTWYREDASAHPGVKLTKKIYAPFQQMLEAVRRRQNVIDGAALTILGLIAMTETAGDIPAAEDIAQAFTSDYDLELNNYVRVGSNEFSTKLLADTTTTWFDNDLTALGYPAGTTIRDVIYSEIRSIADAAEAWQ